MFAGSESGYQYRLNSNGTSEPFVFLGGVPLGGTFDLNGNGLYVCVPPAGLVYVNLDSRTVQIATAVSDDGVPIRFADDAAMGPDGKVYFTDASTQAPSVNSKGHYDAIYASLLDIAQGSGTGGPASLL
jgi:sugar lactone lactonase YvrE